MRPAIGYHVCCNTTCCLAFWTLQCNVVRLYEINEPDLGFTENVVVWMWTLVFWQFRWIRVSCRHRSWRVLPARYLQHSSIRRAGARAISDSLVSGLQHILDHVVHENIQTLLAKAPHCSRSGGELQFRNWKNCSPIYVWRFWLWLCSSVSCCNIHQFPPLCGRAIRVWSERG